MLAEENDKMVRTGPGTPAGNLHRRYWQPVALAEELLDSRPVVPVRLLGEDLALFRNEDGTLGLVERRCAHRGADLALGRLEDGGLRCYFHGWLFGADGQCRETPAEPEGSALASRVRLRAYPARERNGIVWGYLGPGDPPDFPSLDCFLAPGEFTFAFKGFLDCNWLQA
ncbi:MAG: Rieske 2Fe-2S domain-containing protein, partial [Trebonia sp.]